MAPIQTALSQEQVLSYLTRLQFPLEDGMALPEPDLTTLQLVQELHPRHVVFENLSLMLSSWRETDCTPTRGLKLDVDHLFNKIVHRKRGGYCLELNGLLAALLQGLGYTVRNTCARVVQDQLQDRPYPPDHKYTMSNFNHHVLLVGGGKLPAGKEYLVDAGLGGNTLTSTVQIPSQADAVQAATSCDPPADLSSHQYRLRWGVCGFPAPLQQHAHAAAHGHMGLNEGYYLQVYAHRPAPSSSTWSDLYFFKLDDFTPLDYVAANFYLSMHPDSRFVKGIFCSRPDAKGGRHILLGNNYKYRDIAGVSTTHVVQDAQQLADILDQHFSLQAPLEDLHKLLSSS